MTEGRHTRPGQGGNDFGRRYIDSVTFEGGTQHLDREGKNDFGTENNIKHMLMMTMELIKFRGADTTAIFIDTIFSKLKNDSRYK